MGVFVAKRKALSMFDALMQNTGLSAFSLKGFGPLLLEGTG